MLVLIRAICLLAVKSYFKEITITYANNNLEGIESGPILVVANHPNGLLDPLIVQITLNRPIRFLAKSTLFRNIFGRTASQAFGAIPVYRPQDGEDPSKNSTMFDAVYDAFHNQEWVVIFPEGVSHDASTLQPLKTGAARMVLGFSNDLRILPIGITYENKDEFRSRVNVNIGCMFSAKNNENNVNTLTEIISLGLKETMFEAPSEEIRNALFFVAKWLEPNASLGKIEENAKKLEDAYQGLLSESPKQAQDFADQLRQFASDLNSVGLKPWDLDAQNDISRFAYLAFFFPLAALGFLVNYPTYRFIDFLSERMAGGERDVVGTFKTLGGLIFFPLTWLITGFTIFILSLWYLGILAAVLSVPLALFTVHYFELLSKRKRALSSIWRSRLTPEITIELNRKREALIKKIHTMII